MTTIPIPAPAAGASAAGRTRAARLVPALLALVIASACGGDDGGGATSPDATVAPLVGDWEATSLVLTNVANPEQRPDLIALGATFTLNVQPSGQYTATLVILGQTQPEIGRLTVTGNGISLRPEFPPDAPPTTGTFTLDGGRLAIDADSSFDFNMDGQPEPARMRLEMTRRAG